MELNGGGSAASSGGFGPFWAIFGPFGAILGHFGRGSPWRTPDFKGGDQFPAQMVREWPNNGFEVDWSRFGPVWSRLRAVLGRVLAVLSHFWPFLAVFGTKFSLSVKSTPLYRALRESG